MRRGPVLGHLVLACLAAGAGPLGAQASILVYDNNSIHGLAQTAAAALSPAGTVVADAVGFDAALTSGSWDLVVVDCPSTLPSAGWTELVNYVNGGGKAILSFWDWDGSSTPGAAAVSAAFEVQPVADFGLAGQQLQDAGTSGVFTGVTMPNADWHGHWVDDGDEFNPLGTAVGLAHFGSDTAPVIVLGNEGRTIASFVLDEAGDTWTGDGSGLALWTNMMSLLLSGGPTTTPASATLYGCGVNPPGSLLIGFGLPTLGATVTLGIDNPLGTQAVGSIPFLVHAFAPDPAFPCGTSIAGFGMGGPGAAGELLISLAPPTPIAPIVVGPAWTGAIVPFPVTVPNDPTLLGISVFSQGLLSDPSVAFGVRFGLTDAVELKIGN